MNTIPKHKKITSAIILCLLLLLSGSKVNAQGESDPFYWIQDTTLLARLDTVPVEQVITGINHNLEAIAACLSASSSDLLIDSITRWNQLLREAVILKDPVSARLTDTIVARASRGERGHWQYYFVNMALQASFLETTSSFSPGEKTAFVLRNLEIQKRYHTVFYENRLLDLGPDAIPVIIEWAKKKIIPNMDPPGKPMMSEEDLAHYNSYHHLTDLISGLVHKDEDRAHFRNLLNDNDPDVRRFAADVLGTGNP